MGLEPVGLSNVICSDAFEDEAGVGGLGGRATQRVEGVYGMPKIGSCPHLIGSG